MLFRTRVRVAAEEGIVFGVKYAIALLLILFAVAWALRDYNAVRVGAARGQASFELLQEYETVRTNAERGLQAFEFLQQVEARQSAEESDNGQEADSR